MTTLQQLQQHLGVSRTTLWRRRRDGILSERAIETDMRQWLNAEEVRHLLGFSESRLFRMVKGGKFPKPTKRYGRRMWSKDQIGRLPKRATRRYGPRLWSKDRYELWENQQKIRVERAPEKPAREQLRSVRDLCKDLAGCSKSSIYKWLREGSLPPPRKVFPQKRWALTDILEHWSQLDKTRKKAGFASNARKNTK